MYVQFVTDDHERTRFDGNLFITTELCDITPVYVLTQVDKEFNFLSTDINA